MRNTARLSDNDRLELFRNTAEKMGMNDSIVEKDFWVCFILDYLFHRSPWKDAVTFKGGTSLSKAFRLISRFSEDIDLILDWRVLGYGPNEPWEKRSNTKQDALNKEANARAEVFLAETFCPVIKYVEAVPGTLKLRPPEYRLSTLAADYDAMRDMLYGDIPSFASVMDGIKVLEQQINVL